MARAMGHGRRDRRPAGYHPTRAGQQPSVRPGRPITPRLERVERDTGGLTPVMRGCGTATRSNWVAEELLVIRHQVGHPSRSCFRVSRLAATACLTREVATGATRVNRPEDPRSTVLVSLVPLPVGLSR
jgi:hypothetical protein